MKKICFITTISGTLRAFVLETAKYLNAKDNYDITFICDDDPEFQKLIPCNMHYIPVTMKRGISMCGFVAVIKMYKIFRQEKFDLVQYSTPNASCYAAIAAKLARVPVRLYCQWGLAYVGFNGLKRKIFKFIERMVCSFSTWIEPDSFGNLKFSNEEGLYPDKKGSVIWNGSASGVNLTKFNIDKKNEWKKEILVRLNIPDEAFVFGFIGRISKDKGIDELFSANQQFIEKHKNTYLILVGNNEKSESVNKELYDWAINEERVIFCGYTREVEKYLSVMDAYLLPSYREGFGSAVIEAEAMGVPVIVSNIPGPTDAMIADTTGLLVKKGDSISLLNAMEKIYHHDDLRVKLGVEGHKLATDRFEQQRLFEFIRLDRAHHLKEKK